MADKIPFDEDTMTLIMGLGGPDKPGQHGRTMVPAPEQTAIDLITQIRDLCTDYLQSAGKEEKREEKEPSEEMEEPEDSEE
jgi:hypothetical protein